MRAPAPSQPPPFLLPTRSRRSAPFPTAPSPQSSAMTPCCAPSPCTPALPRRSSPCPAEPHRDPNAVPVPIAPASCLGSKLRDVADLATYALDRGQERLAVAATSTPSPCTGVDIERRDAARPRQGLHRAPRPGAHDDAAPEPPATSSFALLRPLQPRRRATAGPRPRPRPRSPWTPQPCRASASPPWESPRPLCDTDSAPSAVTTRTDSAEAGNARARHREHSTSERVHAELLPQRRAPSPCTSASPFTELSFVLVGVMLRPRHAHPRHSKVEPSKNPLTSMSTNPCSSFRYQTCHVSCSCMLYDLSMS